MLKVLWTTACMLRKCLCGTSRLEPLHLVLSSSRHLMRIFGAIILSEPLLVQASQSQTPERGGVRAELVSEGPGDTSRSEARTYRWAWLYRPPFCSGAHRRLRPLLGP
jgi:hypothetical protein